MLSNILRGKILKIKFSMTGAENPPPSNFRRLVMLAFHRHVDISPACWYVDMLAFHRHVGISPACWYVSQIEFTSQVPAQLAVKTCLTIWFKILKYWKGRHERQNKVSQKRGLFLPTGRAVQPATVHLILFDENVGHDYWGKKKEKAC